MNRQQLVRLADAVNAIRPDWQQPGILAQLETLHYTWGGTDGAMAAFVMQIASHPQARTPAAFVMPAPADSPQPRQAPQPGYREPTCHTCNRTQSRCLQQREKELQRGIPDVHDFET